MCVSIWLKGRSSCFFMYLSIRLAPSPDPLWRRHTCGGEKYIILSLNDQNIKCCLMLLLLSLYDYFSRIGHVQFRILFWVVWIFVRFEVVYFNGYLYWDEKNMILEAIYNSIYDDFCLSACLSLSVPSSFPSAVSERFPFHRGRPTANPFSGTAWWRFHSRNPKLSDLIHPSFCRCLWFQSLLLTRLRGGF